MLKIADFRLYLGFFLEGKRAVGILTIRPKTPSDPHREPVDIPKDSIFTTNNLRFFNPEAATLSESADFLPLATQSIDQSEDANVPAGQVWVTPIQNIVVTNDTLFQGGRSAKPGMYPTGVSSVNITDSQLERALSVGRFQLRQLLGLNEADQLDEINDVGIREALMILSNFFLEQNIMSELKYNVSRSDGPFPEKTKFPRPDLYKKIVLLVLNLAGHKRNVSAFMPAIPGRGA